MEIDAGQNAMAYTSRIDYREIQNRRFLYSCTVFTASAILGDFDFGKLPVRQFSVDSEFRYQENRPRGWKFNVVYWKLMSRFSSFGSRAFFCRTIYRLWPFSWIRSFGVRRWPSLHVRFDSLWYCQKRHSTIGPAPLGIPHSMRYMPPAMPRVFGQSRIATLEMCERQESACKWSCTRSEKTGFRSVTEDRRKSLDELKATISDPPSRVAASSRHALEGQSWEVESMAN